MFRVRPYSSSPSSGDEKVSAGNNRSRQPMIRALEPRMVFDAAAAVVAEHVVQAPAHHAPAGDAAHSGAATPAWSHLNEALRATPVTPMDKPTGTEAVTPTRSVSEAEAVDHPKDVEAPEKMHGNADRHAAIVSASSVDEKVAEHTAQKVGLERVPVHSVAARQAEHYPRPSQGAPEAVNAAMAPAVSKDDRAMAEQHMAAAERVAVDPRTGYSKSINVAAKAVGSTPEEIYFIWDNVKDWQQIATSLGDSAQIHVLDSNKDGVVQIADILKGESNVGAIHLISHGAEGSLSLGTAVLNADSMQGQYRDDLTAIGNALSREGDILIYGCDFAAGADGLQAAVILADITKADVAASTDPTGAAALGGDWNLEVQTGKIESAVVADYTYQSLLAAPVVDLDGTAGSTGDSSASYAEKAAPVAIVADGPIGATISDSDGDLQSITITSSATPNGDAEHLTFGGLAVGLGSDSTNTIVVGGTTYDIVYVAATRTFTITNSSGGTIPSGGDTNALIRSITYDNGSGDPTNGGASLDRVFSFTATDLTSVMSAVHTATVTITAVNDAPVGVDDSSTIAEDTVATGNVLANDTDVDGNGLVVTQFSVAGTTHAAGETAVLAGIGTLAIEANGSYTFTPVANYNGLVPVATYTVSDGSLTSTATLTVHMTPVNDPPVDGDETNSVAEDTTLMVGTGVSGVLLDNATDVDGDTLTVASFSIAGQSGPFVIGAAYTITGVGDVTINADGSYSFVPAANYDGAIPAISYVVSDGAGGVDTSTLTLSMVSANDAPAGTDNTVAIAEDTSYTFSAASFGFADPNDAPADAFQAVIITTLPSPADGTLLLGGIAVTAGQSVAVADIGNLTFEPSADVNGTGIGSFTFQVVDSGGTTNGGQNTDQTPNSFAFNVSAVNDAPVASDDMGTTPEDTTLSVPAGSGLLANDTDVDGDTLVVTQFTVSGVTANAGQSGTIPGIGRLSIDADGSYSFVPVANYVGPVPVITYTISDGHGGTDTATLMIEVTAVDDPPVDGDETNSVTEDTTLTVPAGSGLLANTTDVDGGAPSVTDFTVAGEAGPFVIGSGHLIAGVGTVTINADGGYSFVPVANYDGLIPVITYTVSDGAGGNDTSTLTLTLTPVNDAPIAQDDAATTPENTPISGNVLSNDADIDDPTLSVTFFEIGGQTYGAGTTAPIAGVGSLVIRADGSYTFTPAASYAGPVPQATYTVSDGELTDTAVLRLTITPVNDPPVADDESGTMPEDQTLTVPASSGLLVGDTDADGDPLVVSEYSVGGTSHAAGDTATIANVGALTINADGSYTFVPAPDYNGPVPVVTYTVSDGHGGTDQGTLTLTVTSVNDLPATVDDVGTTPEDTMLNGNVLGNDTDVDGDHLTVVGFEVNGIPGGYIAGATATITGVGSVTVNADGSYVLVPAANYNGPVPVVTYLVSDGNGGTATGTLTLDVIPVNDPPIANDDNATTANDKPLSGNVLGNDTDGDGDSLSVTGFIVNGVAYAPGDTATIPNIGDVTLNANGTYTFVPAPGYVGPVPDVTYTVSDGNASDNGALMIDVTAPNAVGANDDVATTPEDTTLSGDVIANDVDPGGGSVTVVDFTVAGDATVHTAGTMATIPGIGDLTINQNGTYIFVPASNYNGPVPVVTYTATNGTLSDTATLTITVTPVNDQPIAVDDTGTTPEDVTLTGNVLTNDTDVDGNTLTVTGFLVAGVNFASGQTANLPTIGRLTINSDGSYSFVPFADYNGSVPVATYTISDGAGGTDTGLLTIGITPVNDAPAAANDTISTPEDIPLTTSAPGLLSNDTDVDGNMLTITGFSIAGVTGSFSPGSEATIPGIGDLTINADGSYSFIPAINYNGPVPLVTYTVTDGTLSDAATLTITVTPVNDAPIAADDTGTLAEDTTLSVPGTSGVLFNDTDIDGDPLAVTQFVVGGIIFAPGTTATMPGVGQLTINADGSYVFTPIANFNGGIPDATYTVSDGHGGLATAVLRITVVPVNDAPVAADDSNTTVEDTVLTGGVLGNDTDIDGDTLSVSQFTVAGDAAVYAGGDTTTITGVGELTINVDGSYTFVPAVDFSGPVPIVTYTASDSHGGTDNATLTLVVTPVNDAPSPVADTGTTPEDTTLVVPAASGLLSNDIDVDGDGLTIQGFSVAGVSGGFLAGATATVPGVGTLTINADGSYSFVPVANYNGPGPVATYRVSDGVLTNTAVLTITVTPVNDPPLDGDESHAVTEDTTLTIDAGSGLLANTTDIDGGTTSIAGFSVAGQAGPFTVGSGYMIAGVGTITVNADGSYSFVPAANYAGPIPVVTYTVSDGAGGTDTSTLTLNMVPVNDPPVDGDEVNVVVEDTTLIVPAGSGLLANATDIDGGPLSISTFTVAGEAGSFSAGNGHLIAGVGTITVNADGSYSFVPAANYAAIIPIITYTVSDGAGGTDTSTLTLTMTPVNDPPVDGNESRSVIEDTTRNVSAIAGLLANTTDVDGGAPSVIDFTVAGEAGPFAIGSAHLIAGVGTITINADGSYSFAPALNYVGPIPVVTYTVSDGAGGVDTSTLTLTIVPANDPPVANDDNGTTPEETTLNGSVLTNDTDIDGDTLTVATFTVVGDATVHTAGSTVTIAGVGELTIRSDGTYSFVPALNYNGAVPVATYTASDGEGGTDTATLTLNVTPVNDPPVAVDDAGTTPEDTPLTGNVLANDVDIDGDLLRVTQFDVGGASYSAGQTATLAGVGELTINALGNYTFVPAANYNGPVPDATYTVSDGRGGTDSGTLTIVVTPVNDAPSGTDIPDQRSVDATSVTPVDVSLHFTDVDGDLLSYSASGLPTGLSIDPVAGVISGTLPNDASHHGPYTVIITATDPSGLSATETFTWVVINPPPVAANDIAIGREDTVLTGTVRANDSDPDGDAIGVARFVFGGESYSAGQTAFLTGVGSMTIKADGSYSFTPAPNYNGAVPVVTYTLLDSDGGADTATLAITIEPVNDVPDIVDDHASGNEDTTITGNVLGNDSDPDADKLDVTGFRVDGSSTNYLPGDTAAIPGVGTITLGSGGMFVFVPAPNYDGPVPDIFYTASDGHGGTGEARLVITIVPIDDFVPLPDQNGPDLPAAGIHDYDLEDVDGAVLDAVHDIDRLNDVGDLSTQSHDDPFESNQDGKLSTRFAIRSFLGGSSAFIVDRSAGEHDRIEVEVIKHAGIVYLQIIDVMEGDHTPSGLRYGLRMADGTPAPAWLRQIGPMTFAGHPAADESMLRLILSVIGRDGRVSDHELILDTRSGQVSLPEARQPHAYEIEPAPMFSAQLNEKARSQALLEKALGFM